MFAEVLRMDKEKKHIFDNLQNVKRILYIFFTIAAGLLLTDFFFHRHVSVEIEKFFGFYAFFGLIGSVFLVLSAKELRKIIKKTKHYVKFVLTQTIAGGALHWHDTFSADVRRNLLKHY